MSSTTQKSYVFPMIIIGALFFIFGFVTWLNGVLIPFLKQACELETDFQSYLCYACLFYFLFHHGHSIFHYFEKDRIYKRYVRRACSLWRLVPCFLFLQHKLDHFLYFLLGYSSSNGHDPSSNSI